MCENVHCPERSCCRCVSAKNRVVFTEPRCKLVGVKVIPSCHLLLQLLNYDYSPHESPHVHHGAACSTKWNDRFFGRLRLRLSLTPNFISGFCCAPPVTQQLLIFSNLYMLHLYQLIHAAHVTYLYLSLVTIRFVLFMYVTQ
jgi:hypothetical protein